MRGRNPGAGQLGRGGSRAVLGLLLAISLPASGQALAARYAHLMVPPLAQTAEVSGAAFQWAGLRFLLRSGTLAVDAASADRLTTAVFSGEGVFQVLPPDAIEAGQMQRFSGRNPLETPFTQAVFRFADGADFLRVLGDSVKFHSGGGAEAEKLLKQRAQDVDKEGLPEIARLLQALQQRPLTTIMLAQLRLPNGAWLSAEYDPSRHEPLRVYQWNKILGTSALVPEVWTQFTPMTTKAAPPPAPKLSDYDISAAITGHFELTATAAFHVTGAGGAILLGLDSGLRVESASSGGAKLQWLQPQGADWVYVELPASSGQPVPLELSYRGRAPLLEGPAAGEETSLPGWYPTLPLDPPWARTEQPANFDLKLETDKALTILPSGNRVNKQAGAHTVITEWRSPIPLVRAGFEFGRDRQQSRVLPMTDGHKLQLRLAVPEHNDPDALLPLAGTKLVGVLNFLSTVYGPYPYPAIYGYIGAASGETQLLPPPPMLVAFDPESFLDVSPGLTHGSPAVAVAGQWFGGWMWPETPHDAWLTEGLREFSGLMAEEAQGGDQAALTTVRSWREYLQRRQGGNPPPLAAGPLWLGADRLDSRSESGGELLLVKGAYVLYMLRQMMVNPRSPAPNAAFDAMLRDFVATYGGHAVTTAEFQAIVEKHMTPAMNLTADHKMDWFFRPALEGMAVPTLTFSATIAGEVKGVAQVKLTVENPDGWVGLLPVYLFRDANTWVRGTMQIDKPQVTLTVPAPFTPRYVEADHMLDMLVNVRQ